MNFAGLDVGYIIVSKDGYPHRGTNTSYNIAHFYLTQKGANNALSQVERRYGGKGHWRIVEIPLPENAVKWWSD